LILAAVGRSISYDVNYVNLMMKYLIKIAKGLKFAMLMAHIAFQQLLWRLRLVDVSGDV